MALRRFICRRGQVQEMISDNGTNNVGAEWELWDCIARFYHSQIKHAMLNEGIKWSFNPPSGPHHGRAWERLVHTIKKTLYSVLKQKNSGWWKTTDSSLWSRGYRHRSSYYHHIWWCHCSWACHTQSSPTVERKTNSATWVVPKILLLFQTEMETSTVYQWSLLEEMDKRVSAINAGKTEMAQSEKKTLSRKT